ncbi:MAG TPA: type 4 pilus major pilin [Rhodanobacteraceae bacterium]|nr:type 4 pilus major pilin [Rhodanobacteraceae bacterium]
MRNLRQMNMHNLKGQAQGGFSLLELMIGIGVAAALIGFVIYLYVQVNANSNSYKSTQTVLTISTAVKTLYPSPNYNGVSGSVLASSKKVPDVYVSGTNLINPFGQTVTVASTNIGSGTDNGYIITFPGVPTNECTSLASAVAGNFVKIEVGTTAVKDDTATTPVAYSTTTAVTACSASNSNTLKFTST